MTVSTAALPATEERGGRFSIGRIWQTFGPLLSLIILSLLIWSQSAVFMTSGNWLNVALGRHR